MDETVGDNTFNTKWVNTAFYYAKVTKMSGSQKTYKMAHFKTI